jgi:hypothetical protein
MPIDMSDSLGSDSGAGAMSMAILNGKFQLRAIREFVNMG